MTRPAVSVVMPFAGDAEEAARAVSALRRLDLRPGDQLILADNSGTAPVLDDVRVVRAMGERSPARARNAGAEAAGNDWVLFLDADTEPPPDLLDAYFAEPVADEVGALAGEVTPSADRDTMAERYAASRNFLGQAGHLAHPYMPRAAAANLLVRRSAFVSLGGFYEGVRAAEDTDFAWRLQRGGWRLELRARAAVRHRYRSSLTELRRQWRGYAAGRAWLRRRYRGFLPEPAVRRGLRRMWRRVGSRPVAGGQASHARASSARASSAQVSSAQALSAHASSALGRRERLGLLAVDAVLAGEELAGFALSNRPRGGSPGRADVVLVADRFPAREDPLVDYALRLGHVRVEAAGRPRAVWAEPARQLEIAYREDDGTGARAWAVLRLVARHPLRVARDRRDGGPALAELAPVLARLRRDRAARLLPLGADPGVQATAGRLARLAGRDLDGG